MILKKGLAQTVTVILKQFDAGAGEIYYILIDRASGSAGFDINLTGSATTPTTTGFNTPEDLEICSLTETNTYNLTDQRNFILQDYPDTRVSFHQELGDANLAINELPDLYTNTIDREIIYARIYSPLNSCSEIVPFEIRVTGNLVNENPVNVYLCGTVYNQDYDLLVLGNQIINSRTDQEIVFYTTEEDRDNGQNAVSSLNIPESGARVYYEITRGSCRLKDALDISYSTPPSLTTLTALVACRGEESNLSFNLTEKYLEALSGQDVTHYSVNFYADATDRDLDENRLSPIYNNTPVSQQIFMRVVDNRSGCHSDTSFEIEVNESPQFEFPETLYYCTDLQIPVNLSVSPGFTYYKWSTGEEGNSLNEISINEPGTYTISVYNEAGCSTTKTIEVLPSSKAEILEIQVTGLNYPQNGVTIEVSGNGDYEFSIDDGPFLQIRTFNGLSAGYHYISVRDRNGCGTVITNRFLVLDYPRYFTPNNDGYHDTWHLTGLNEYPGAQVFIYDRYGKLLKQLQADSAGWDGTYLNKLLIPDDFWFRLVLPEGIEVKGHFSLIF